MKVSEFFKLFNIEPDEINETKEEPKEELKEEEPKKEEPKIDERDLKIKSLEEELRSLRENNKAKDEQIVALKELSSVNNPIEKELTLQELIEKGEF